MNVCGAAGISHGPHGAKAVAAISAYSHAAKALKALVCLAAIAGVVVVAFVVALPYFNLRAYNWFTRQIADIALNPGALAFGVALLTIAQQVKV